jgi:hypothetical protein
MYEKLWEQVISTEEMFLISVVNDNIFPKFPRGHSYKMSSSLRSPEAFITTIMT